MPSAAVANRPSALPRRRERASIRVHLWATLILSVALVAGIGGWAMQTEIAGAVVAPGQLMVESDVKKVQHPSGGVVGALLVREGARVKAGDILVRLDATQTQANLDIVRKALDELSARRARAEAERDGVSTLAFPADLLGRRDKEPDVDRLVEGETRFFAARAEAREGQRAQLRERVKQTRPGDRWTDRADRSQGPGDRPHPGRVARRAGALRQEPRAPLPVTALERDATRLEGERGQLIASTASARGRIAETELQIVQIDSTMRTEVGKDLAEIRGRWSELVEKRVAAEDQLKRIDLRAPQDGTVHQMSVHTVGGLVVPTEPAMLIVPHADALVVEAKIQPQDIDSVRTGQKAVLRFPAFNTRTTPEIDGVVARVSADVATDLKTGLSYYVARVALAPEELARLGDLRLVPGMPVEAHLQIGERTVLSYLTRPLTDQIAKAWKER